MCPVNFIFFPRNTVPSVTKKTLEAKSRLVDYSASDKPWDVNRARVDQIEAVFTGSAAVHHRVWAERLKGCSVVLGFGWETDTETGEFKLRLRTAGFCRVRTCAVCQWRRSMKHKARLLERLPKIEAQYPGYRWLFLTLTIRNCEIDELRASVQMLVGGFRRLRESKQFPAMGWIRTVEVTRGKDGSAHPHLHCLLLVKPSYFSTGYIKAASWVALWRRSMKLDYDPIVDVRAVKPNPRRSTDRLESVIAEIAKYSTKPADMVADDAWLRVYADQTHKLRFVESGGCLKSILADDYEDLINVDEDVAPADDESGHVDLRFGWDRSTRHYRKKGSAHML